MTEVCSSPSCSPASSPSRRCFAVRWVLRRVDTLGRIAPFPKISVGLTLVLALCCAVPMLVDAWLEHRLEGAASRIAGGPVRGALPGLRAGVRRRRRRAGLRRVGARRGPRARDPAQVRALRRPARVALVDQAEPRRSTRSSRCTCSRTRPCTWSGSPTRRRPSAPPCSATRRWPSPWARRPREAQALAVALLDRGLPADARGLRRRLRARCAVRRGRADAALVRHVDPRWGPADDEGRGPNHGTGRRRPGRPARARRRALPARRVPGGGGWPSSRG